MNLDRSEDESLCEKALAGLSEISTNSLKSVFALVTFRSIPDAAKWVGISERGVHEALYRTYEAMRDSGAMLHQEDPYLSLMDLAWRLGLVGKPFEKWVEAVQKAKGVKKCPK